MSCNYQRCRSCAGKGKGCHRQWTSMDHLGSLHFGNKKKGTSYRLRIWRFNEGCFSIAADRYNPSLRSRIKQVVIQTHRSPVFKYILTPNLPYELSINGEDTIYLLGSTYAARQRPS